MSATFDWDLRKDRVNQMKHGVSFAEAQLTFFDPRRVIVEDVKHSSHRETRWFCIGRLGDRVLTVRFTYRGSVIRIFGADYWTKGKRIYEQANQIRKRSDR